MTCSFLDCPLDGQFPSPRSRLRIYRLSLSSTLGNRRDTTRCRPLCQIHSTATPVSDLPPGRPDYLGARRMHRAANVLLHLISHRRLVWLNSNHTFLSKYAPQTGEPFSTFPISAACRSTALDGPGSSNRQVWRRVSRPRDEDWSLAR